MTARCALAQVYALLDWYGTGKPEVLPVVNVTQPNGVAWLNGSLFIAQPDAILQYAGADDAVLAGRVSSSACNFALIYCSSQVLMGQEDLSDHEQRQRTSQSPLCIAVMFALVCLTCLCGQCLFEARMKRLAEYTSCPIKLALQQLLLCRCSHCADAVCHNSHKQLCFLHAAIGITQYCTCAHSSWGCQR